VCELKNVRITTTLAKAQDELKYRRVRGEGKSRLGERESEMSR
jgi:hypothetical protein